jgi:hypothetical protein
MKNFIHRVQNSDESTKRFWVVLFSGTSMLLVVALWLFYINMTIARVEGPSKRLTTNDSRLATADLQQTANDIKTPGFLEIFASGTKIIFTEIRERLSVKNEFIIENPKMDFVPQGLPEIKPTKLPEN